MLVWAANCRTWLFRKVAVNHVSCGRRVCLIQVYCYRGWVLFTGALVAALLFWCGLEVWGWTAVRRYRNHYLLQCALTLVEAWHNCRRHIWIWIIFFSQRLLQLIRYVYVELVLYLIFHLFKLWLVGSGGSAFFLWILHDFCLLLLMVVTAISAVHADVFSAWLVVLERCHPKRWL